MSGNNSINISYNKLKGLTGDDLLQALESEGLSEQDAALLSEYAGSDGFSQEEFDQIANLDGTAGIQASDISLYKGEETDSAEETKGAQETDETQSTDESNKANDTQKPYEYTGDDPNIKKAIEIVEKNGGTVEDIKEYGPGQFAITFSGGDTQKIVDELTKEFSKGTTTGSTSKPGSSVAGNNTANTAVGDVSDLDELVKDGTITEEDKAFCEKYNITFSGQPVSKQQIKEIIEAFKKIAPGLLEKAKNANGINVNFSDEPSKMGAAGFYSSGQPGVINLARDAGAGVAVHELAHLLDFEVLGAASNSSVFGNGDYVTPYAGTNRAEDFAESFRNYVLGNEGGLSAENRDYFDQLFEENA